MVDSATRDLFTLHVSASGGYALKTFFLEF